MGRNVEAILFDYGRVIVGPQDEAAFQADLAALSAQYGNGDGFHIWTHIFVSDEWERAKRGRLSHEDFWARRLALLGIQGPAIGDFKAALYRHWGLLPGMTELLKELHGRYRLGVLSNTSRLGFAEYLRERRGLGGLFDAIVSSAEEGLAKPDPRIYAIAVGRLGVTPGQTLFIDDQVRNTAAAEAAGLQAVVFTDAAALRARLTERGLL